MANKTKGYSLLCSLPSYLIPPPRQSLLPVSVYLLWDVHIQVTLHICFYVKGITPSTMSHTLLLIWAKIIEILPNLYTKNLFILYWVCRMYHILLTDFLSMDMWVVSNFSFLQNSAVNNLTHVTFHTCMNSPVGEIPRSGLANYRACALKFFFLRVQLFIESVTKEG